MTDSPDPDPLAFTPAPVRARRDGWTPDRQRKFIQALAAIGAVAAAARAVGKSATAAYALRERAGAESFAAAWDMAVQMAQDRAFEAALDRAMNGYEVPRYYAGRQVGTVRKFDYRLALAVINAPPPPPLTAAQQAEVDRLFGYGEEPWGEAGSARYAPSSTSSDPRPPPATPE
jgi:hypothetical protein